MKTHMVLNERGNEIIAVIISFMHTERGRIVLFGTSIFKLFEIEFLLKELIVRSLID